MPKLLIPKLVGLAPQLETLEAKRTSWAQVPIQIKEPEYKKLQSLKYPLQQDSTKLMMAVGVVKQTNKYLLIKPTCETSRKKICLKAASKDEWKV